MFWLIATVMIFSGSLVASLPTTHKCTGTGQPAISYGVINGGSGLSMFRALGYLSEVLAALRFSAGWRLVKLVIVSVFYLVTFWRLVSLSVVKSLTLFAVWAKSIFSALVSIKLFDGLFNTFAQWADTYLSFHSVSQIKIPPTLARRYCSGNAESQRDSLKVYDYLAKNTKRRDLVPRYLNTDIIAQMVYFYN